MNATQTREERRATIERERLAKRREDFDILQSAVYGYSNTIPDKFPNLHWTEGGRTRLAVTAGWIVGLQQSGKSELALELASDLLSTLRYLNGYGGQRDVTPEDAVEGRSLEMPAWRVVLGDDGTMNGFRLAWYMYVPDSLLKEEDPAAYHIDPDLELHRYYWSKNDPKRLFGMDTLVGHYGYSHNGGLLYHGPKAGETYAVTMNSCLWSVHT
jgi:hypothetical protein